MAPATSTATIKMIIIARRLTVSPRYADCSRGEKIGSDYVSHWTILLSPAPAPVLPIPASGQRGQRGIVPAHLTGAWFHRRLQMFATRFHSRRLPPPGARSLLLLLLCALSSAAA